MSTDLPDITEARNVAVHPWWSMDAGEVAPIEHLRDALTTVDALAAENAALRGERDRLARRLESAEAAHEQLRAEVLHGIEELSRLDNDATNAVLNVIDYYNTFSDAEKPAATLAAREVPDAG